MTAAGTQTPDHAQPPTPTQPSLGTVHVAPWVVPVSAPAVREGAVWVVGDRIRAVGPARDVLAAASGAPVREWAGTILPGLVNAHTHLQYTRMAEVGRGAYTGFEDWSHAFQELYERPGHDWRDAARQGVALAVASGTTALADIVTSRPALDVLRDERVHGIAYWELMGWLETAWQADGARQTEDLLRAHGLAGLGISPHAPYSLDTGVLADLTRMAGRLGLRRHLHLAESAWEDSFTLTGTGDLADQWRAWGFGEFALLRDGGAGHRPVPYADHLGVLGPDLHIAHGVYADAGDRAILRARDVTVALCPRSNAVIGLEEAPVADYLREGALLAVGTDSLSSSPSLDLLGETSRLVAIARRQGYRHADLHQRILEAATCGGARAMGLATGEGRLGVLEPGAAADMAISAIVTSGERGPADLFAALTEDGEGQNIGTIIDGSLRWTREASHDSTRGTPRTSSSGARSTAA